MGGNLMFKSLFGRDDENDGVEIGKFEQCGEEDEEEKVIIRKGKFKILNTQIIYDNDECSFYTLATCVNEKRELETISLEGFSIDENVTDLAGSLIQYEEYLDDEEEYVSGKIFSEFI
jgi:hypothetical protein